MPDGPRSHELAQAAEQVVERLRGRSQHLCLEYAGARTAYHSDEAASGGWIERFLGGYFTPCTPAGGRADVRADRQAEVYSTGDATLFDALRTWVSRAPARRSAATEGYASTPLTDAVELVHTRASKVSPEEDVFHLLFAGQRRILLVTSGNPEVRREEGMQIVRSVTKWLLIEQGWIPMHSACVAKDGRAICIIGEKASGKTTTLLNLLAHNGCQLLAVDKFLVRGAGSHVQVRGLPGKTGIRVGSAIGHPALLDWLTTETASFFPHMSAREVQQISASNTPEQLRNRREKIHLLPSELAGLFGTSIEPAAPLHLILIPVFDPALDEARLVPARAEDVRRLVAGCYAGLRSKGEDFLLHFFELSDDELTSRLGRLLTERLPAVDSYQLHQNQGTNEQASALVAAVLD